MSYELSRFERIASNYLSCTWKLVINKYVSKEQIEEAIYSLTKDYSFLSSEYVNSGCKLVFKPDYHPPVHYFEKECSSEEYFENMKKATGERGNYTSEYFIYASKLKDLSEIIGIYNHGMVDGISSLDLCHRLCLHLSDPTMEPELHCYVSAQGRLKIPKEYKYKNYEIDPKINVLQLPTYLHECRDVEKMYNHVYTDLIKEDELKEILKYTKEVKCSFQGLLWICTLLSQMKMFNVNDFSKPILFHSMATSRGRAEFDPPILDDDIMSCGFYSYILKKINRDDKIVNIIRELSKELHNALDKKQQLYDFFHVDNYKICPCQTLTCCTLGKRPNQKHYDGKFSFDVLNLNFLASSVNNPNNCGLRLFCFSIEEIGCFVSSNYVYPQFVDEEMKNYVEDIIKMMKYCSKEENFDVKVEELMKI